MRPAFELGEARGGRPQVAVCERKGGVGIVFSCRKPETGGETTIRAITDYVNDILLNSINK